jgi:CheY-like chemotaxis protein
MSSSLGCVLVVDDDEDIRDTIQMVLESSGIEVATASDGGEALATIRSGVQPFLIVLDIMMPGMSGPEFMEERRRDPDLARFPVAVISGDGRVKLKAAALGADEALAKPIQLATLMDTVNRYRNGRSS